MSLELRRSCREEDGLLEACLLNSSPIERQAADSGYERRLETMRQVSPRKWDGYPPSKTAASESGPISPRNFKACNLCNPQPNATSTDAQSSHDPGSSGATPQPQREEEISPQDSKLKRTSVSHQTLGPTHHHAQVIPSPARRRRTRLTYLRTNSTNSNSNNSSSNNTQ